VHQWVSIQEAFWELSLEIFLAVKGYGAASRVLAEPLVGANDGLPRPEDEPAARCMVSV